MISSSSTPERLRGSTLVVSVHDAYSILRQLRVFWRYSGRFTCKDGVSLLTHPVMSTSDHDRNSNRPAGSAAARTAVVTSHIRELLADYLGQTSSGSRPLRTAGHAAVLRKKCRPHCLDLSCRPRRNALARRLATIHDPIILLTGGREEADR